MPGRGGQVVAVESYLDGDSNFSAQLTNIAAQNPEALYIAGYYTEAAEIARQAALQGLKVRIMGADGFDSPDWSSWAATRWRARCSLRASTPDR